jgi:hypothetical protein
MQVSAEKDLPQATADIANKTMTVEYNEYKFVAVENIIVGALKTFSYFLTSTADEVTFTFLFQLLVYRR